ncbi:MAG: VPLPA-CTERM sorting domain-containing protein [Pseudomonadota bacterium]
MGGAASAITLDFDNEDLSDFQFTDGFLTGYEKGGLVFSITHEGANSNGANLFNAVCDPEGVNPNGQTSNCTTAGDDRDLVPAGGSENGVEGNILIRQENGEELADDARGMGIITFTLEDGAPFSILGFSAVDNENFQILVDGMSLGTIFHTEENETTALVFDTPSRTLGIDDSFQVKFFGSGGVDSIQLAPVPVPAGLPLLFAGLGALAWMRRRKD